MARQNIGLGALANDGTGDTLRQAGAKINQNFVELYQKLGNDSDVLSGVISVSGAGLSFEGTTVDNYETLLIVTNPTADNTINLPNASGEVVLNTATQTLTNKTLTSPILTSPQINDASATHQYVVVASELAANRNITLPILSSNDTFVFAASSQTLTNKTLTTPTIDRPSILTRIFDQNNAGLLEITATASAVNHIEVANAATGANPRLAAYGTDTNISLSLNSKGTGSVRISKAAYGSAEITANGAASTTATYIICNKASALAVSVADGTVVGEYKIITNKGAGIATVTPTNFAQGTSFALNQYDGCQIVWDGTDWYLIGNQSQLTIV